MSTLALSPAFLPSLVAFAVAPATALRSWIAVQALPAPLPVDAAAIKSSTRRRKAAHFLMFLSIIGLEFYLIANASQTGLGYFMLAVFGMLLQTSLMMFFGDHTGSYRWAVYRAPSGRAVWRFARESFSWWRGALVLVAATAVNAHNYMSPGMTLTGITSTALVYRLVSQAPGKNVSIRGIIFVLLGWIALTAVFAGVAVMIAIRLLKDSPTDSSMTDGPGDVVEFPVTTFDPENNVLSPEIMHFVQQLMPLFWAAGPGFLIAACMRFDYAQHLSRNSEDTLTESLATVDAPRCPRNASRGVVVPAQAPQGFAKPYYFSALLTWTLSQLAVATLFTFYPLPAEFADTNTVDMVALVVEIPSMVVAVLATSKARGEFRDLWSYREEWTAKPDKGVQLVEGELLADLEDVPDYEEAVKEDVAPAYVLDAQADPKA